MAWQDIARGVIGGVAGAAGDTQTKAEMDTLNQQARQGRANQLQLQMAPVIQSINADKMRAASLLDPMGNVLPGKQNDYDDLKKRMALNFGKVRNLMGDKEPAESPGHMSRAMAFIEDHLKKAVTGKMGEKEGSLGEKQNKKVRDWGRVNQAAAGQLAAGTVPFESTDEYKKLKMQEEAAEARIRSNFQNFKNPDGTVVSVDVNHQMPPVGSVRIGNEPAIPKQTLVTKEDGSVAIAYAQPDGSFKDQAGNALTNVKPYQKPPTALGSEYSSLLAKKKLADSGKGPKLTPEEEAKREADFEALTAAGIARVQAGAAATAANNVVAVTDPSTGQDTLVTRAQASRAARAGRPYGAAAIGSPTSHDKQTQMYAVSSLHRVSDMRSIIKAHPEIFGPGGGRATDILVWLGGQSPDAQRFMQDNQYLSEHTTAVFGGRAASTVKAVSDLRAFKTNAKALEAGLDTDESTLNDFTTAGGRLPAPRQPAGESKKPAPKATPKPSAPSGGSANDPWGLLPKAGGKR